MTPAQYAERSARIDAYLLWLRNAEQRLAQRPTPRCEPADKPSAIAIRRSILASL